MKTFDALVIGGGPSGSTAGALLARAGWSVAVFEKARFPRRKVCGEFVGAPSFSVLREVGIDGAFVARAGPEVRRVGLYAGEVVLGARMPRSKDACAPYGRALAREELDSLLLEHAAACGASVEQGSSILKIENGQGGYECAVSGSGSPVRARILIAAHGSWEAGALPTQVERAPRLGSDLLAFKARFLGASLPEDLMPLIAFPGGYGGMVRSDAGRTSLSLCIRRDVLQACRRRYPGLPAGEAVLAYIKVGCRGVRVALEKAIREGAWLAAGPIRPGMRTRHGNRLYAVGNAAGEAHPIIAEGIGMAMQSASLLCKALIARPEALSSPGAAEEVAARYEKLWSASFAMRVTASQLFARLAMRESAAVLAGILLKRAPSLLTLGALLSGKAQRPVALLP